MWIDQKTAGGTQRNDKDYKIPVTEYGFADVPF